MSSVSLVLYCEGSTDKYFLPTIILQRFNTAYPCT